MLINGYGIDQMTKMIRAEAVAKEQAMNWAAIAMKRLVDEVLPNFRHLVAQIEVYASSRLSMGDRTADFDPYIWTYEHPENAPHEVRFYIPLDDKHFFQGQALARLLEMEGGQWLREKQHSLIPQGTHHATGNYMCEIWKWVEDDPPGRAIEIVFYNKVHVGDVVGSDGCVVVEEQNVYPRAVLSCKVKQE